MASRGTSLAQRQQRHGWWALLGLVIVAAWAYIFLTGDGGWLELQAKRQTLAQLEAEVMALGATNDSLRQVLWRLEHDPAFVERMAREVYGLVMPGEYLYRVTKRAAVSDSLADGQVESQFDSLGD